MKFPAPVPEIPVTDLKAAIDYYQRNLRFSLDWGDDELGIAGISNGECRMFLASEEYRQGHGNGGPALIWLNLDSRDEVDQLHHTWSTSGARLTSAPDTKPWGLYEFTATDLDGNIFRVFFDFGTAERDTQGK